MARFSKVRLQQDFEVKKEDAKVKGKGLLARFNRAVSGQDGYKSKLIARSGLAVAAFTVASAVMWSPLALGVGVVGSMYYGVRQEYKAFGKLSNAPVEKSNMVTRGHDRLAEWTDRQVYSRFGGPSPK